MVASLPSGKSSQAINCYIVWPWSLLLTFPLAQLPIINSANYSVHKSVTNSNMMSAFFYYMD